MPEVISAAGLTKRFGAVAALDDVSFTVEGPGVTGILGPNGAGKTTLLDILEGITRPDHGDVRLFGRPLDPYPRRRVGVVLQRELTMDAMTARDYADLFAAIYGVEDGRERILRDAALEDRARVRLDRLSGGEAARLFVAAAVAHEPDLVLLDEPTASLDPGNKKRVGERLRAIGRERTVVLSTHDLREAEAICDRLVFLLDGRVRASGEKDELVAAVPSSERRGAGLEDAFFHFCAVRMHRGEIEEP